MDRAPREVPTKSPGIENQQKTKLFQHFQHGSFKNQRFFNILSPKAARTKGFSMVFGLGKQAGADEARQGQPSQAKPDRSARLGPPGRPWEPKSSPNHRFFTIRVPKRAKGPAMSQVNLLSWCAFWAIVGRGCALISSACNGRKNSSRELYQHMA